MEHLPIIVVIGERKKPPDLTHCFGCASIQMETISEATMVHGINSDGIVEDIKNFLEHNA